MKLHDIRTTKISPIKDNIMLKWLKPKLKSGILVPETVYESGLRRGHFYLAKVLNVGPDVKGIKINEVLLIHEYGTRNVLGGKGFEEDKIYFIKERSCRAIVTDIQSGIPLTQQRLEPELSIAKA